jgi:uncharacterized protein
VILIDTGPLVALFDPKDPDHGRCRRLRRSIREPICSTVSVLTEAFHVLQPHSVGADRLREFIVRHGLDIWFLERDGLTRAFELMETYADHPMDLADASLVVAAERLATRRIFTLGRSDFATYRVRLGHRHYPFEMIS